jgi:hypothetical protein
LDALSKGLSEEALGKHEGQSREASAAIVVHTTTLSAIIIIIYT